MSKRSGLLIATTIGDMEHGCCDALVNVFTRNLPHKGAIPPLVTHKMPLTEKKEHNTIIERMN